jgi:hypothetical protein
MPELAYFLGIHVYIYWVDHMVPHVHAYYGGTARNAPFEATYRIADGHVLVGRLPPPQAKRMRRWIRDHQAELRVAWEDSRRGSVKKIR